MLQAYELLREQDKESKDVRVGELERQLHDLQDRFDRLRATEAERNNTEWQRLAMSSQSKRASNEETISTHLASIGRAVEGIVGLSRKYLVESVRDKGPESFVSASAKWSEVLENVEEKRQGSPSRRRSIANLAGGNEAQAELDDSLTADTGVPKLINEEDWEKYKEKSELLFPVGRLKFRWDLFMLALILYSAVTVPFRLGMDHGADGGWWYFEVAVSFFFITDLCLNFMTAYLEGDQYVLCRVMIRNAYFKGWFLLDLSSSIPLELVDLIVGALSGGEGTGGGGLRMLRALRLVRLLRLLRLLKIQQYINILEDALNVNLTFIALLKLLSGLGYLTHILGCTWYWLGSTHGTDDTWLNEYEGGEAASADAGVWVRYLYSVYWALTTLTTVGYGDITPQNDAERLFAFFVFLVGALVFGYMLSSVGEMVRNADPNACKIEEKLDEVKVYLRWHKFKPDLAIRVRRYYEFYFSRKSAMDEDEIVNNLAPTLRRAVQAHLVHRTVTRIPLFQSDRPYINLDIQLELFGMLQPLLREAKESITESLDKNVDGGPSIYFARRGTLSAVGDLHGVTFYEVDASVHPGTIVGEYALTRSMRCDSTFRAKTRVEIFTLSIRALHKITSALDEGHRDELSRLIYQDLSQRKVDATVALSVSDKLSLMQAQLAKVEEKLTSAAPTREAIEARVDLVLARNVE